MFNVFDRLFMLTNLLTLLCLFVHWSAAKAAVTEQSVVLAIEEFTEHNITSNLDEWDTDLVIMFYAPWCKYCKQLLPTWGTIASLKESDNDIAVGKFDCERSDVSEEICKELGIDRYPSVYFIGYGNFNHAEGGALIGNVPNPRVVRYSADLYPEALYDWVNMLATLSKWQRRWDDFKGFFTGRTRSTVQLQNMKERVAEAERKAVLFGKELERYKANEIFDELEDHGDPFPLMHSLEPDEMNLPLRVCVAEMATEYCRYYADEHYCGILKNCSIKQMAPKVCRPESCPFTDERGCRVVSTCMQTDIIMQYKEALATEV